MTESILTSVKKMLGITEEYTHFDADIIMHINSVFVILYQMGVGPSDCFSISDKSATWTDFGDGAETAMVKSYLFQKVKLIFDPPQASAVIEAMNRQISEMEWRLNVAVDPGNKGDAGEIQNG